MSEKNVGITVDQLADLMKEMRKPVITEADIRKEAGRKQMAQQELAAAEERDEALRLRQENCSHAHWDGKSRCVHVKNESHNYMLCQFCQKIIRPGVEPHLFNRHLQTFQPAIF